MKKYLFICLLPFLLISCNCICDDSDTGSLVISNNFESSTAYISEVFVKEKEDSGFVMVYSGRINNSSSYFIKLKTGLYSVKVCVNYYYLDGAFETTKYFNTGYNIYGTLSNKEGLYVAFDGEGIYFN